MMAISTKGRYSLRILVLMASHPPGRKFTKQEIADLEEISPAYVQQLLMTLHATGFVASHRGKTGGFILMRSPETVTVADVLEATEGQILPVPCLGVENCERESTCPTRPLWMKSAELLEDLFSGVTIATLAAKRRGASIDGTAVYRPILAQSSDFSSQVV
jgi:Rrf2 family protein